MLDPATCLCWGVFAGTTNPFSTVRLYREAGRKGNNLGQIVLPRLCYSNTCVYRNPGRICNNYRFDFLFGNRITLHA